MSRDLITEAVFSRPQFEVQSSHSVGETSRDVESSIVAIGFTGQIDNDDEEEASSFDISSSEDMSDPGNMLEQMAQDRKDSRHSSETRSVSELDSGIRKCLEEQIPRTFFGICTLDRGAMIMSLLLLADILWEPYHVNLCQRYKEDTSWNPGRVFFITYSCDLVLSTCICILLILGGAKLTSGCLLKTIQLHYPTAIVKIIELCFFSSWVEQPCWGKNIITVVLFHMTSIIALFVCWMCLVSIYWRSFYKLRLPYHPTENTDHTS